MKLCVIGNSHVGMLRAALRDLGESGPEVTFFAKAGAGIERATIRGPVIAAEDPGLRAAQARFAMPQSLDVSAFDATVLVAGIASIYSALRILQTARVSGWPSSRIAEAQGTGRPPEAIGPALVSEPAFVATLADEARTGYAYRFARAIRAATEVPLFLVPQPFPSERVFDSTRPREFAFQQARRDGDGARIAASLRRAIDRVVAEIDDLAVLHQPADTVAHGFTTAARYTRDAVRVDGDTAQHAGDLLHVGPAFGKRVLARVTAEIAARTAA